jgi:hypothetical protein
MHLMPTRQAFGLINPVQSHPLTLQGRGLSPGVVQAQLWTGRRPVAAARPLDQRRRLPCCHLPWRRPLPNPAALWWRSQPQPANGLDSSGGNQPMQEVDAVYENQRFFGLAW